MDLDAQTAIGPEKAAGVEEASAIEKQIGDIEAVMRHERPSSLAGAMFQMLCAWGDVDTMASLLPDEEQHRREPIRRMMPATLDCLKELSGVEGRELGREYTGPNSNLG